MNREWGIAAVAACIMLTAGCGDQYGSEEIAASEENDSAVNENAENETKEQDWFNEIRDEADSYFSETEFETVMPEELYDQHIFDREDETDELIVDVRDLGSFTEGNIPGSVNIPFGQSGNYEQMMQLPKDRPLTVVCFSGHTASQFAGTLNTLGYDAKPLQYGMGGYTSDEEHGADIPAEDFGFPTVTDGYEAEGNYEHSSIMYEDDLAIEEVILSQSASFLEAELANVIPAPEVKEIVDETNLDEHQLIDIRSEDHYEAGHIEEAVNIPYHTLFTDSGLSDVDPDRQAVIIGYNGHDASQVSRALNHLNIEAVPMMFGMSIWTDDETLLGEHQFDFTETKTYPVQPLQYDPDAEEDEAGCS
ncbi:rhodanese-like domain-containing protein [Salisediminibacterium halotolerans]|uniref:Rhodanese-related sulfurtransferase n=1 Tax=Salisediminibacterium halotolerans TaxID=517425 RepID=A0A1H9WVR1_9BACI|nr:rhodanese-like domain-containing protein [Salisediminibacterium haloalkalitolerans]SES37513.1 Rhodanese-related sulfurtransferase [Salisediminibacterium haloalkalitolerans]